MIYMELSGTSRSDSILISFSCKEKEGGETAFSPTPSWTKCDRKSKNHELSARTHEDIFVRQENVATHHICHRLNI